MRSTAAAPPQTPSKHGSAFVRRLLLALGLTGVLWSAPMIYLVAHEGGHCLAYQHILMLGPATLYLGCREDLKHREGGVVVCPAFWYSFLAQHGYCEFSAEVPPDASWQAVLLCVSGGLVGGSTIWLLLALCCFAAVSTTQLSTYWDATHPQWAERNRFLMRPASLFSLIQALHREQAIHFETALVTLLVSWLAGVMNVNRVFYTLFPTTPDAVLWPGFVGSLRGDGLDLWRPLVDQSTLLVIARGAFVTQWALQVWLAWRAVKIGMEMNKERESNKAGASLESTPLVKSRF